MSFEIIWIPDANVRVLVVKKTQPKINDSLIPFSFHSPFFSFSEHTSNTFFTCFFFLVCFYCVHFSIEFIFILSKGLQLKWCWKCQHFSTKKNKEWSFNWKDEYRRQFARISKRKDKTRFFYASYAQICFSWFKDLFQFCCVFFFMFLTHICSVLRRQICGKSFRIH